MIAVRRQTHRCATPDIGRARHADLRRFQEAEQLGVVPRIVVRGHGARIIEAGMLGSGTADHAPQIGTDLVGPTLAEVVALLAARRDLLAGGGVGGGQDGAEVRQRLFRGGGGGRRLLFAHAFDHIARLGRRRGLENRFGREFDDQNEDQCAEHRAGDFVPFPGIHIVRLRSSPALRRLHERTGEGPPGRT